MIKKMLILTFLPWTFKERRKIEKRLYVLLHNGYLRWKAKKICWVFKKIIFIDRTWEMVFLSSWASLKSLVYYARCWWMVAFKQTRLKLFKQPCSTVPTIQSGKGNLEQESFIKSLGCKTTGSLGISWTPIRRKVWNSQIIRSTQ